MFRIASIAAVALGLLAVPAAAETVEVQAPLAAASVQTGALDMVAYYRVVEGDVYEVTTIASERSGFYRPTRIVMGLDHGASVAFSVPGYPETLYHVSRYGKGVRVTAQEIEFYDVAQIN